MDSGLIVAASSDCPVVPPDPRAGIFAAVSRRTVTGQLVSPEQRLPLEKALALYTISAARSQFSENKTGSITPGKLADLVIISNDPARVATDEIKRLDFLMTILDGRIVYRKGL